MGLEADHIEALERAERERASDAPTGKRIRGMLEIGATALDMEAGHLAQVLPDHDRWIPLVSTDPDVSPRSLDWTHCRETLAEGHRATADASTGVGAYLGVALASSTNEAFTVSFTAPSPRPAFTAEDVLFATSIARMIERERDLDRLAEYREHLEAFVSMISHDLRNPLTVARGWVEAEQTDSERESLERALTALSRLETLLEDGVTYARGAAPVVDPEPVDLRRAAETAWGGVRTGEATLRIEAERVVLADEGALRTMLERLFENAAEFGGETVTIESLRDEPGFVLRDEGSGLPDELRDRVLETGVSSVDGRPGLGLAIADAIARAHGWHLSIDDTGDGTDVTVRGVIEVSQERS